jgi:hypothetical protein
MEDVQKQINKLRADFEAFVRSMGSRRGPEGAPGKQGPKGDSIVGPEGKPGKDANITEVVAMAKKEMQAELASARAALTEIVREELTRGGTLDSNGKAILLQGPAGRDGVDGKNGVSIRGEQGLPGKDGASIRGEQGLPGRDAVIAVGNVSTGSEASVSMRVVNGVSYFDFVLPRGEKGERGEKGDSIIGPKGEHGEKGDSIVGPIGPQGIQGERGERGEKGDSIIGPKGDQGAASVIPGPVGPQGIEGLRGLPGKPGDIQLAIANAEREARSVVKQELTEQLARLQLVMIAEIKKQILADLSIH